MKKLIYLPFLLTMFSCSEEDTKELVTSSTEEQQVEAQLTTPIPNGFIILDSTLGDLDKDNIEELVVAYNIEDFDENDEWKNIPRTLIIYKNENNEWTEWYRSEQALLGSQDGGMMGDPYEGIVIENGILKISHWGGSSWKWGYTDKYRFQDNDFFLIGYTSNSGKPGEYWENWDFNLSTGKIIVKKEYETSDEYQEIYKKENEKFFEKGLKITMNKRQEEQIIITSRKYKHELYIAYGPE